MQKSYNCVHGIGFRVSIIRFWVTFGSTLLLNKENAPVYYKATHFQKKMGGLLVAETGLEPAASGLSLRAALRCPKNAAGLR